MESSSREQRPTEGLALCLKPSSDHLVNKRIFVPKGHVNKNPKNVNQSSA